MARWIHPTSISMVMSTASIRMSPKQCPVKYPEAWAALDVGFDGHDYQVWSLEEILEKLRPRLAALEDLKRQRGQFDPFRGRGHRGDALSPSPPSKRPG